MKNYIYVMTNPDFENFVIGELLHDIAIKNQEGYKEEFDAYANYYSHIDSM